MVLVTPKASGDLLSVMEIIKPTDGRFLGGSKTVNKLDGQDNVILRAYNREDDYWKCTDHDRIGDARAFKGDSALGETDPNEDTLEDADPNESQTLIHLDQQPHYSAGERMRACEAFDLCANLRHPGDDAIIKALDNGTFASSHLTAQDFRIGRALFGACPARTEGKIRARKEPTSKSEPARAVGDHLHGDFIILKNKSIGGNTIKFVTVDEKSNYLVEIPLPTKGTKSVQAAGEGLLLVFNTHQHVMHHLMDSPTRQEGDGSQVETKTDITTQKSSIQHSIQSIDFSSTLTPSTISSDVSSKKPETPKKVVLASPINSSITTPSKSSSPTPKISTKETTSSSVEQANGRSKRSTAGSWLDGPSNSKSEDFVTIERPKAGSYD
jgi:hypothetical protein